MTNPLWAHERARAARIEQLDELDRWYAEHETPDELYAIVELAAELRREVADASRRARDLREVGVA